MVGGWWCVSAILGFSIWVFVIRNFVKKWNYSEVGRGDQGQRGRGDGKRSN